MNKSSKSIAHAMIITAVLASVAFGSEIVTVRPGHDCFRSKGCDLKVSKNETECATCCNMYCNGIAIGSVLDCQDECERVRKITPVIPKDGIRKIIQGIVRKIFRFIGDSGPARNEEPNDGPQILGGEGNEESE